MDSKRFNRVIALLLISALILPPPSAAAPHRPFAAPAFGVMNSQALAAAPYSITSVYSRRRSYWRLFRAAWNKSEIPMGPVVVSRPHWNPA